MNTKTIAILLIGVIVGSAAGYFGNIFLTQPTLDDLQDRLYTLEEEYDTLESSYMEISEDKADLEAQLETLQDAYTELQSQKNELDGEYSALVEQVETLEALYESLLEDYQASLGGLDFSNQTTQVQSHNYTWIYSNVDYTLSLLVPEAMYEYYSSKPRYETIDYRGYILQPIDDEYIEVIIKEFDVIATLENMTTIEEVELITTFVQSLHYLTDDTTGFDEYPKFPAETLVDEGGDCEDTSILLAHMLEAMNIETALITLPGHMAVGVAVNASGAHWTIGDTVYYYQETTVPGWEIGNIPIEHVGKTATLYEVDEMPFLTHTWEATRQNEIVTATINYTNEGKVNGEGYRAWIGIELESGELYSEQIGGELDLAFGESRTVTLSVQGPRDDTMRLIVGVLTPGNEVITKKHSTYFTTR